MNKTENSRSPAPGYGISVAAITTTKKRGRPVTGYALSQAERDARYHAKKAFIAAARKATRCGLDPAKLLEELYRR